MAKTFLNKLVREIKSKSYFLSSFQPKYTGGEI